MPWCQHYFVHLLSFPRRFPGTLSNTHGGIVIREVHPSNFGRFNEAEHTLRLVAPSIDVR